ncbi:MAG: hypothetical protein GX386_07195 [Clostridiaceae bacterium]|jgi:multisubunit Na+/H+ antiporter MnhG subunit|nr:hypothetical protein [Clostridiaceae bacterium]
MTALKIIAFTLLLIGSLINYGAKLIVKRLNLFEKIDADEAEELTGEEFEQYKMTKAIAKVKVVGVLIMLPGAFLIFYAFR